MERKIKNHESYTITDDGKIYSYKYKKKRQLKTYYDKNGYENIKLSDRGEPYHWLIHRLVAEAFIDNPNNYPMVNHKDCNPKNNAYYNLEWCTAEYNSNYNIRNALISDALGRAVERYSLEGEFIDAFDSAADACRKLGWPPNRQSNISAVCRGVRKSTLGYMWKFKEES